MRHPAISYAGLATPSYGSMMDALTSQARAFHGVDDSALDSSCKVANPGTGIGDRACFDQFRLQKDYITTPTMQRTSQRDRVTANRLLAQLPAPAEQSMARLSHSGMTRAAAARPNLSVLSPNCSTHVTFRTNTQVIGMRVLSPGPILYNDLWNWTSPCLAGACPAQVVKLATPIPAPGAPVPSTCP